MKKKSFKERNTINVRNFNNSVLLHNNARSKTTASKKQFGAPYQNIKNYITARIEAGEWMPETRVPSENHIAGTFGVSRGTAHRALRELTSEGYLVRIQGIGTFVAMRKQHSALLEIKPISDEIAERGETHSAKVHLLTQEMATSELAVAFDRPVGSLLFRLIIIHLSNGRPLQLADRYVNPSFAPGYMDQDFTAITPSQYLFQLDPLTEAEHIIEAILPDKQTQDLLEIEATEPCLVIHRRTWSNNLVVSKAKLVHPGSRFQMGSRFKPSFSNRAPVA